MKADKVSKIKPSVKKISENSEIFDVMEFLFEKENFLKTKEEEKPKTEKDSYLMEMGIITGLDNADNSDNRQNYIYSFGLSAADNNLFTSTSSQKKRK